MCVVGRFRCKCNALRNPYDRNVAWLEFGGLDCSFGASSSFSRSLSLSLSLSPSLSLPPSLTHTPPPSQSQFSAALDGRGCNAGEARACIYRRRGALRYAACTLRSSECVVRTLSRLDSLDSSSFYKIRIPQLIKIIIIGTRYELNNCTVRRSFFQDSTTLAAGSAL